MNDVLIRQNFRIKNLRTYKADKEALVIEELGLNHGKSRADIAVLNGRFIGYEIKSNNDSLRRLDDQIKAYNSVFDEVYVVVGDRYSDTIHQRLPLWWGIIKVTNNNTEGIDFEIIRKARTNKHVDPISVARLLWRDEVLEVLKQRQISPKILRQPRAILYQHLVDTLNISEIRKMVRDFLKKRKNWRYQTSPLSDDDLSPLLSTASDS
jgi:hypothetical protein